MRNGSSLVAWSIATLLIAGSGEASAQQDLLDFGDASEEEKPSEETPPPPPPPPPPAAPADEPVPEEPATIDEPGDIDEPNLDEPADEPSDTEEPSTETAVESGSESSTLDPARLDRIKAVPRKAVLKKGRIELAPFASLSMNDAFYQHFAVGGALTYFPHDSFGFGVGVDYIYSSEETSNVDAVRQGRTSVPGQFEQPELFGHFDLYWVPIYGKASLFDQHILHFEFYATGGLGIASSLDDDVSPAANFGIGQRTFINEWFGLRIEARNHLYVTSQTVNRIERSDLQSILLLYVGASFFIPPSFEYSFL